MQEVLNLTLTETQTDPVDPTYEMLCQMASANAVVVLSLKGCCICHVVKQLLIGLGVGPTVIELDPSAIARILTEGRMTVPSLFVGGKLLGGMETVIAYHISGDLVPLLKDAGALWL